MSLLQHNNNQPSSSPSKSSLRRVSGTGGSTKSPALKSGSLGPTTHFASEATQHHFLPHSPPNQTLDYEEEDDELATNDDDASYQTAPQPQRPFQPFFTLIEDTLMNEHYHPTVHYIFADDEPDIITEAACRSLEQNTNESNQASTAIQEHESYDVEQTESRLPQPQSGLTEHYLILDIQSTPLTMAPASQQQFSDRLPSPSPSSFETTQALAKTYPYTVTATQSLSADWQIVRTNITNAPTMNAEQRHPDEQHLMLRIEGRKNSPDKLVQRRDGESMEDMIERFRTRLSEIRQLMVDLDDESEQQQVVEEEGGDMFAQGGLVGIGFQPTGFGNAVLDEQD
ncbi:hypothetical protein LTR64_006407 [Lithohypha guttulata]|uniref:uncharacterized protein n=1 Tax=Lithohypha guttulata TaxID=1690604 RepID=UPI002DE1C274|nr:hypothetical protein LTR51_001796 [Lithohypha guttulata]